MPKFVPRERKHKKLARQKHEAGADTNGVAATPGAISNALEIAPSTANAREARKAQLKSSALASDPHMSSKKRKRLEKYLDTKLRKEDTLALIKRLEVKQKGVDRSLLQSSQKLGRQVETKRELYTRSLKEKDHGVRVEEADEVLFKEPGKAKRKRQEVVEVASDESEDDEAEYLENGEGAAKKSHVAFSTNESTDSTAPADQAPTNSKLFGSGLKRPLELDENGKPVIAQRKRRRTGPLLFDVPKPFAADEPEWDGFSDEEKPKLELNGYEDISSGDDSADSDVESEEGSSEEDEDEEASDSDDSGSEQHADLDSASSDEEDTTKPSSKTRTSAFKAWAEQQRNDAIGFTPSTNSTALPEVSEQVKKSFAPRPAEIDTDALPESLKPSTSELASKRTAYAVPVQRTESIQTARLALPVLAEEQRIMEAVFANDVVIISGATGSGKTTQVPQFLFEHGFGSPNSTETRGMIGITQPRRVAAVSMANRVGEELGDMKSKVAHQIRFDSTTSKNTAVKFMTDGVLLREMSEDFSLRKYSAIVIDEAHERTVNTDILISLMSRCVQVRRDFATKKEKYIEADKKKEYTPLKLIIMSATLRVEDFRANARLFPQPPPIVEAEGRQYDVTVHWSRKTSHDFVEEAFKKVTRGHRKLPIGGMLVFLTGQQDIKQLARRLKDVFQATKETGGREDNIKMRIDSKEMAIEEEDLEDLTNEAQRDDASIDEENENDSEDETEDPDAEFVIEGEEASNEIQRIHLLPLYSQLPSKEQLRVFQPPPPGSRLIILATNVAETSLTIPGIRYVFDCGRHKQRTWDRAGVQTFRTTWISKASADQRMGRAGRTGPGHCWRLYSSAVFEDAMPAWSEPEIMRASLEGVVLQLKALGVEKASNFPWPTPPDPHSIRKAERLLRNLGAIDGSNKITPAGRELQRYPLSPRFAQMLRLGIQYGVTEETITLVAALDVPELIIPESQLDLTTPARETEDSEGNKKYWTAEDDARETAREARRKAYSAAMSALSRLDADKAQVKPQADALRSYAALFDYLTVGDEHDMEVLCRENFLREKGMKEALQLYEQLRNIVKQVSNAPIPIGDLKRPKDRTVALLKQIVAAGFLDQVAIRADLLPNPPTEERKAKRAIDVKYKTLFASIAEAPESEDESDGFAYVHPSSLLARLPPNAMPRYIVYHTLQMSQSAASSYRAPRLRMHPLTPVSAEQLASLARGTGLLEVGKPVGKIEVLERSAKGEERRECDVILSLRGDAGGDVGWPLCRKRVVQKRVRGSGWEVETWK